MVDGLLSPTLHGLAEWGALPRGSPPPQTNRRSKKIGSAAARFASF
jgi:hypothetical protein